ncbi:hypothetical protein P5808_27810 [Bacillus cereus]|uniref:hypothetical protein n=1 Tax=Bacillus cereus TaxID=1396 RepID=UPI002405740D|nr:hypothetical protein [Bacillus cereus]MDF9504987.1 hypothetical protein [Bacillus cereus]MDF9597748.1 hypothetical protein [Bacillus cereus]MDF9609895.1 hypothetical protein [Bacillus cereus]MDF9660881.1 hypothetical protein [Bacillus cereus]
MIKKIGYLKFKKSKGNYYVYLVKSVRESGVKKDITLYKFGRLETALENMFEWRNEFELFPKELLEMGYTWEDLHEWVTTLETGYSPRGIKLCIVN